MSHPNPPHDHPGPPEPGEGSEAATPSDPSVGTGPSSYAGPSYGTPSYATSDPADPAEHEGHPTVSEGASAQPDPDGTGPGDDGAPQPGPDPYAAPASDPYAAPASDPYAAPASDPYAPQGPGPAPGAQQPPAPGGPYGPPPAGGSWGQQAPGQQPPFQQGPPPQGSAQQGWHPQPGPGQPPGAMAPGGQLPVSPSDEKLWGTLTHVGMIITTFLTPLIIYLVYKDRSPWLRANALASLNFGILSAIVLTVSAILMSVVIGFLPYIAMYVVMIVFGVQAAMKANQGEFYKYPFNVNWVK